VLKDKDYYDVSGGGVTVSGGEPFVQFDFFLDILKQAKVNGLHTAVETTGNTDFSKILEAEPYLDLFLFDMKHLDPEEITRVTKGNGSLIQENFRHLAAIAPKKIIMRVPVIPGFNYASETLEGLIRMAKELDILEVHLLPYHNLGANKYRQLGQTYELEALKMMNKKELEQYTEFGKSLGIHVQAGG
jgi:pyruvate formate lyase activating enzyme